MEGNWRDLFARVAEVLTRVHGIVAGSYDEAEIWEVAAMLGANDPDENPAQGFDEMQYLAEGFDPNLLQ